MSSLNKVMEIIAEVLEVPVSEINKNTAIGDIPSWDSLRQMMIIDAIEVHFNFHFDPEVILNMEDVSDIVFAVDEKNN
ncbi:acyl carrier protein [Bacteroides nordii]|jgi:acyl carrier protein|uniref:acyl carrier protein n=2 Tax=Bacteroides nordii TaxID=291645 RepID=UPI0018A02E1B|nr:acyl carrier protein [Bacteroides nordii]